MHSYPTLVIFCKRPKLEQGKQRLASTVGTTRAFAIAKAMLACAVEDAEMWQGPVVLAVSCSNDIPWARLLMNKTTKVMDQGSGNLGDRIDYVDTHLRAQGHQSIVYIGTDAPMLRLQHYESIAALLSKHTFALSKAKDGGVTMMGSNTAWPSLTTLPWSTPQLGEALINASHALGSVGLSETSYDIDVEQDLVMLVSDLTNDKRLARQHLLSVIQEKGVPSINTKVKHNVP